MTGLDFSPVAIDAARDLSARAGLSDRSTFICTPVDAAIPALGGAAFDIVYVSLGSRCWLQSVSVWAQTVSESLRPGGRLYVHDVHQVALTLGRDARRIDAPYFEQAAPMIAERTETSTNAARPLTHTVSYEWNHSPGEIVTALLERGIELRQLMEHDWTNWQCWPWMVRGESEPDSWTTPSDQPRLPLSFTLVGERSGYSVWVEPVVPGTTGCT